METFLPLAEQLDRAAVELCFDHPLHNRLALILIDNAIELMARCSLSAHSAFGGEYPNSLNTGKQRKRARSQKFGDRLEMLIHLKELSQAEVDFILAAHSHRNIAYHEGFGGGAYLRGISFAYYRFACRYLTRFTVLAMGWSSNFEFSDVTRHYYDTCCDRSSVFPTINRRKLATALEKRLPVWSGAKLQDALADAIDEDRRAIGESFKFMMENCRPRRSSAELFHEIQLVHARETALHKQGLENTHFGTQRRGEAEVFLTSKWKGFTAPYRAIPHGAWARGAQSIRGNMDDQAAVVQFERLREKVTFLREAVCGAAFQLEMEIQSRYD